MLTKKYSDQISYYLSTTPAETDALIAGLPRGIREGIRESLVHEGVLLRYDAPSRCAYHIARQDAGLAVWTWCDLGLQASANLLSSLVEIEPPMTETLALQLAARSSKGTGASA